jgi:prefoldin subunit 5
MFNLTDFEKGLGNFADRVDVIVGLEIGDKLSSDEAYKMIKEEFKKLKKLRKEN